MDFADPPRVDSCRAGRGSGTLRHRHTRGHGGVAQRLDRHREPERADGRGPPRRAWPPPHAPPPLLPVDPGGLRRAGAPRRRDPASCTPARPRARFAPSWTATRSLFQGGLELRQCPRLHFKAIVVDGAFLYLGSANWTGAGLGAKGAGRRNFELGFVTADDQLLDRVQAIYDRIWSGAECGACKMRDLCPGPLDIKWEPSKPCEGLRWGKPSCVQRSSRPAASRA